MVNLLIRIILSAICIMITSFFTPGMSVMGGLGTAIVAGIVMGGLNWLLINYTDLEASPSGRGFTGFILAAIIIYLTGKFVSGFHVSLFGAIIGALILGVVNALIPAGKIFD